MKKILFFVVTSFTFFAAEAQISLTPKAGINLSSHRISNDWFKRSTNAMAGYTAGLSGRFHLSDHFFLQPEIIYSLLKSELDHAEGNFEVESNYMTIPVMAGYAINDFLHIEAGPQVGFLLSGEANRQTEKIDLKDHFTALDVGAAVGAGLNIHRFSLDLRYYIGLNNINDQDFLGDNESRVQNQYAQVMLGYTVFKSKK